MLVEVDGEVVGLSAISTLEGESKDGMRLLNIGVMLEERARGKGVGKAVTGDDGGGCIDDRGGSACEDDEGEYGDAGGDEGVGAGGEGGRCDDGGVGVGGGDRVCG